jgi:hypothetical protein
VAENTHNSGAEKACNFCGATKVTTAFAKDPTHSDGLTSICGDCRNANARGRYQPKGRPVRSGPAPLPARDGDKVQARHRINVEVRSGRRPHPNELPCADCGHVWTEGERRHEYDHHLDYAAEHHLDVEAVCTRCHSRRDNPKAGQTTCAKGHEFTPENTFRPKQGGRACRECRRGYDRSRTRPPGYWKAVNDRRRARRLLDGVEHTAMRSVSA